ncbi:hypothetical protein PPL_04428 [Heterostelium album PN500]|uniref:Peptidase C83 domain-containing protein n=1 Tax=Heterostelium pallidum (strain ATCC 26659 / Pp 5 / PN500) TaxID=670386 RepID=D3B7J0_HETP5|nr:hypothetical protein PPL_04428 [Heterostelium album PN500]EFA82733.1 hypothetical protein PPL_04428 [Heterostelium album PN500]|eukprot:XP_020434850.1 hypothetical protein PPL_04428 [Heterostelium album PN500]
MSSSSSSSTTSPSLPYSTSACCSANHISEQKKQVEQLQQQLIEQQLKQQQQQQQSSEFCNLDAQNHLKKCTSIDSNNKTTTTTATTNNVVSQHSAVQQQQKQAVNQQIQQIKEKKLKPSFYQRPLPAHLIAFSSEEGRKLFRESLQDGHMEGYFSLAEQFVSQSEPAFYKLKQTYQSTTVHSLWIGNIGNGFECFENRSKETVERSLAMVR